MNGYSKLRLVNKSRSIDFSDLSATKTPSHQTQKVHENIPPSPSESDNQDTDTINHQDHDQFPPKQQQKQQKQDEDEHQAACSNEKTSSVGAKYLSKNHSVSSATSSQRFKLERERITTTKRGIQSALTRAFSMRRSSTSSVSHEKYCRIHDQCVAILLDDDGVDEDAFEAMEDNITSTNSIGSPEKKKFGSKSRILKACKRIFGF